MFLYNIMISKITDYLFIITILNLWCSVVFTASINYINNKTFNFHGANLAKAIQKYFPYENNVCVVQPDNEQEIFLPRFSVPVVIFTQHEVLRECNKQLGDQNGYIFISSNTLSLEVQTVPLLKCFNSTTLKLKTKYILVIDISMYGRLNQYEDYKFYFQHLWKGFGIINVAVLSFQDKHSKNGDVPTVFTYNPFLAKNRLDSIETNNLLLDIRSHMIKRFCNLHGQSLKAVFYSSPLGEVDSKDPNKKKPVGSHISVMFKQTIEEYFNLCFDMYEPKDHKSQVLYVNKTPRSDIRALEEVIKGRAEFMVQYTFLSGIIRPNTIQNIITGITTEFVFVVPKPREVENWRLFLYIFQWRVSIGLVLSLLSLSLAAAVFVHVHSTSKTSQDTSTITSEVISVCKSVCSVSINRLPSTHSQRLLMAVSLLLGLIFVTLFCSQLFALMKSKPTTPSIKTLQDLHDSNLPIYSILNELAHVLNMFANTSLSNLKDNFKTDKIYENPQHVDPKYLNLTDRALLYTSGLLQIVLSHPKNREFLQYFEVIKEPVFQTILVFNVQIGSVYFDHFNQLSLRLAGRGIYLQWIELYGTNLFQRINAQSVNSQSESGQGLYQETDKSRVPLTYSDLEMAFYTLYIGLTISGACFVIEICNYTYKF